MAHRYSDPKRSLKPPDCTAGASPFCSCSTTSFSFATSGADSLVPVPAVPVSPFASPSCVQQDGQVAFITNILLSCSSASSLRPLTSRNANDSGSSYMKCISQIIFRLKGRYSTNNTKN